MVSASVVFKPDQSLASQVCLWLLSLLPEEVAVEPRELLCRALDAASRILGAASPPELRLLLVALLARQAVDDPEREWTGDSILESALREELPRLHAIQA